MVKLHIETFTFEGDVDFDTAHTACFRIYNGKDAHGNSMNKSTRRPHEQSTGTFSTIMKFDEPPKMASRPEVFKLMAAHHKRLTQV